MVFDNPYWSDKLKIEHLQQWIIVHSILYYELNTSIVDDFKFDKNARQLVKMQNKYPESAKKTEYWYLFFDFDGTTGFDLFGRLKSEHQHKLMKAAQNALWLHDNVGRW